MLSSNVWVPSVTPKAFLLRVSNLVFLLELNPFSESLTFEGKKLVLVPVIKNLSLTLPSPLRITVAVDLVK
jgi:hypothetical protein